MIILLREHDDTLHGVGFTEEEEKLPIMLAKCKADVPATASEDQLIHVAWYRQLEGDPNKKFIQGVCSGRGRKQWTSRVRRGGVLLIGAEMKKDGSLTARTRKSLADLGHEALAEWEYRTGAGLVRRE